jgi:hypothetical protein
MNTWIYKMVAMRRRFRVAAELTPPGGSERIYLDRRSRKWNGVRSHAVERRPGC